MDPPPSRARCDPPSPWIFVDFLCQASVRGARGIRDSPIFTELRLFNANPRLAGRLGLASRLASDGIARCTDRT
jgi:hypothetical protein